MKIALIGTGHMGSWFARELTGDHEIAVYDSERKKMKSLHGVKQLKSVAELDLFKPQLLLNTVSLKNTIPVFEEVGFFIDRSCVIVDIASIKGEIPEYYRRSPFPFVSIHPMFGPHFANLHQLQDENVIIISESNKNGKGFFKEFFAKYKVKIFETSFEQHDELMAYSLTLPFASSIVFSACVTTNTVPGTTFSRHRQIAQKLLLEDDFLLSEVLFNKNSISQLENIVHRLEFLKHVIRARDYEEAQKFFNKLRENLGKNGDEELKNSRQLDI
jgi:prephenate dehydrogenase